MGTSEEKVPGLERWGLCAWGGDHPADKFMSGTPICWKHWYWIKLDLPAAECWSRLAPEFLGKIDSYDLITYFPACGVTDEEKTALISILRKISKHSDKVKEGPL